MSQYKLENLKIMVRMHKKRVKPGLKLNLV